MNMVLNQQLEVLILEGKFSAIPLDGWCHLCTISPPSLCESLHYMFGQLWPPHFM
jgi:hypothetical protein